MTIDTLQQIWKSYQDAWADIAVRTGNACLSKA
jgi:hypothetical protein